MNYLSNHLMLFGLLTAIFSFGAIVTQIVFLSIATSQSSIPLWKFLLFWGLTGFNALAAAASFILFLIGLFGWAIKN